MKREGDVIEKRAPSECKNQCDGLVTYLFLFRVMIKWLLGFVFFLQATALHSQGFLPRWIGCAEPDSTSELWFRHTYLCAGRPRFAAIEVTTTGFFDLYVNGYNVSTDSRMPFRPQEKDDRPICLRFDVTRFLRPDSNTIALWYGPSYPHVQLRQVAVSYFGRGHDDRFFSFTADENWLCRKAYIGLDSVGGEVFRAPDASQKGWNGSDFAPACWQGVACRPPDCTRKTDYREVCYPAERVAKVLIPAYRVVEGDTVCYEFQTGFYGYVRATLRNAHRDSWLNINGLRYQCRGETDEQAYRKFTRRLFRRVWATGDGPFRSSRIERIEGIETRSYQHFGWQ